MQYSNNRPYENNPGFVRDERRAPRKKRIPRGAAADAARRPDRGIRDCDCFFLRARGL